MSVEPFHLDRYLDEQVCRFNNRGGKKLENRVSDAERFTLAMSRINGKRLTYAKLTGKQVDSLHHSGGRDADRGRTLLARIFAGLSAAFRLWLCRSLFLWDGERIPHRVLELFPCFRPFVVFCFPFRHAQIMRLLLVAVFLLSWQASPPTNKRVSQHKQSQVTEQKRDTWHRLAECSISKC